MNGRKLLAIAFIGLAGLAGALWLTQPRPAGGQSATAHQALALSEPATAATRAATPRQPANEAFVIKRILPIDGPIKYGEWHWDEAGAPADGPLVITVDLDARVLSVFRGGYEIAATAVLLGTQEKPTPTGVFPITQKKRHHISNLYGAEMPYMQRLTDDGITLHASEVEWGYASHGCIGMPEAFAAKIFALTHVGDRVFITRGKMVGLGDSLVDS
ncbi:MAG TPA: L,D-transpeptidase family protein [Novosphingobium sp.]|nr:L,D-transpeptidase family protein [Novosphingobium sp.]